MLFTCNWVCLCSQATRRYKKKKNLALPLCYWDHRPCAERKVTLPWGLDCMVTVALGWAGENGKWTNKRFLWLVMIFFPIPQTRKRGFSWSSFSSYLLNSSCFQGAFEFSLTDWKEKTPKKLNHQLSVTLSCFLSPINLLPFTFRVFRQLHAFHPWLLLALNRLTGGSILTPS